MRLGYFGGSFDPPHRAHLLAAELARQQFSLDRVLLAPTGRQPFKTGGAQAPFADRLHMVGLLCEGHPGLEASAIDGPLPGGEPNYTVDTLRRLRASLPTSQLPISQLPAAPLVPSPASFPAKTPRANTLAADAPGYAFSAPAGTAVGPEIFAIVGADAFQGLRHWRDSAELLRLAQWIVISRPGFALETGSLHLTPAQQAAVHLLPGLDEQLSATELRRRLHAGQDCHTLLPPAVLAYLEAGNLYRGLCT